MPATEVYSALEKNVVDAAAWTSIGLMQWKWEKFLRHRVGPEFFQTDIAVIMNLAKWNGLPAATKAAVEKAVIEHEGSSRAARQKERDEEQAQLQKGGMKAHALPGGGDKKWHQLSQDAAKERMLGRLKSANRPAADGEAIWKAYHK
jgi:TRAP-type C4-dicarboxylate transport system substrate-binding protein